MDEMPNGYNIGWDVVGDKCVTTGAIPSSNPFGGYYLRYETLIWNWDGIDRTNIVEQITHHNEQEAKKVHEYITDNLRRKE